MKDQNHIQPSKIVPTFIDMWARGLDVDVALLNDVHFLRAVENGRADEAIQRGLKLASDKGDDESFHAFKDFGHAMEFITIATDYYANKPQRSTVRYGESDSDQVSPNSAAYLASVAR